MKKLTIVITCKQDDTNKARIAAVDPAIEIVDASQLHGAEQEGDFNRKDEFDKILARAVVTYGLLPPKELVKRAPNLKWVQTVLAGLDQELYEGIFRSPALVTIPAVCTASRPRSWCSP